MLAARGVVRRRRCAAVVGSALSSWSIVAVAVAVVAVAAGGLAVLLCVSREDWCRASDDIQMHRP